MINIFLWIEKREGKKLWLLFGDMTSRQMIWNDMPWTKHQVWLMYGTRFELSPNNKMRYLHNIIYILNIWDLYLYWESVLSILFTCCYCYFLFCLLVDLFITIYFNIICLYNMNFCHYLFCTWMNACMLMLVFWFDFYLDRRSWTYAPTVKINWKITSIPTLNQ